MSQLSLQPGPPPHRVRALAGVLAGFAWPDRGSFEKLTKDQKQRALDVAARTLEALRETDG